MRINNVPLILMENIPILSILSGTFASKSYGPSLTLCGSYIVAPDLDQENGAPMCLRRLGMMGINLVIQTVSAKCVSTKCAEEGEPVQN